MTVTDLVIPDTFKAASTNGRGERTAAEFMTELGYARRLIADHRSEMRYVSAWHRWLTWDGCRWVHDTTGQVSRWAKVIARDLTTYAVDRDDKALLREAKRGESSAWIAGALKLASTEEEIAVTPDQLDADPFLLNCRNGVVDLRTGELLEHDPARLLTKATGADYLSGAHGPEFAKFLERIQPDEAMRSFLARLLGHTLEGRVTSHLLPIFFGAGANGKSRLLEAVSAAMGDYAGPADPELLTARTFDAHPTGVADLFGLRLAVLHESDHGRRLAEGTVKRLTGGDKVKARRMREDFWSFEPSHTFVMLTNHKPLVGGSDEGIWRRLRLVPFEVVIPPAERDEHLGERIAGELDAVLAWLIEGYQDWRRNGLAEPADVMKATDEYRLDSDALKRFLESDRCFTGPHHKVRSSELFGAWSQWCADEDEQPGTDKAFTKALKNRGYDTKATNVGAVWQGIGLAADDKP